MSTNSKYKMFRNFMYNELEITKEDIKKWTKEAVYEVAQNYIDHHLTDINLEVLVKQLIVGHWPNIFNDEIKRSVAEEIMKLLEVRMKIKEDKQNDE